MTQKNKQINFLGQQSKGCYTKRFGFMGKGRGRPPREQKRLYAIMAYVRPHIIKKISPIINSITLIVYHQLRSLAKY